jgi:hypothetical protein
MLDPRPFRTEESGTEGYDEIEDPFGHHQKILEGVEETRNQEAKQKRFVWLGTVMKLDASHHHAGSMTVVCV